MMLIVLFDIRGNVPHECATGGQKVTKKDYPQVLYRLRDAVSRKRPYSWMEKNYQLHHDNSVIHSSHLIQNFLMKHEIRCSCRLPISLHPRHSSLRLLGAFKTEDDIERFHFDNREVIMQNAMAEMNTTVKEAFHKCFRQWKSVS